MSEPTTPSQNISTNGSVSSRPFREAVVSSEPDAPQEPFQPPEGVTIGVTRSSSNPTLEEYTTEHGQPLSTELLGVDTPYHFLPAELQQQLDTVDTFVSRTLESRGVKPTVTSAAAFLEELRFDMGLDPESSPHELLESMSAYASNMLKLDGLDDIRKSLKTRLRSMRNRKAMDNEVLKAIGKKII